MKTVAEISSWMGAYAPLEIAESWDNVGLLWGDPAAEVRKIMTCLTVTPETAREAIDERADMIIAHHPILFRPVQKITASGTEGAMLWSLARSGIAIYSPHTAFDNAEDGINQGIARRLKLNDVGPLIPGSERAVVKVVTFAPSESRETILSEAFANGAGQIGRYSECSFTTGGKGTFFGDPSTNPAVGQPGRREQVREWKIEIVCDEIRLDGVLAAIRRAHPYEEPAIDMIPLKKISLGPGTGRIGTLPAPLALHEFARMVGFALSCDNMQIVGNPSRGVSRIAIVCGAGDGFLLQARKAGADVLLTGEARFHRGLEADAMGLAMVVAGHHATERPGVEDLATKLGQAFGDVHCWASRRERDPFQRISPPEKK